MGGSKYLPDIHHLKQAKGGGVYGQVKWMQNLDICRGIIKKMGAQKTWRNNLLIRIGRAIDPIRITNNN